MAFALAFAMAFESPASANSPPATTIAACEQLPTVFIPNRTARNAQHGQALELILDTTNRIQNPHQRAASVLPAIRSLLGQSEARSGPMSAEAGMLKADIARLMEIANQPYRQDVAQAASALRQQALPALATATSVEGVEVWVQEALRVAPSSGPNLLTYNLELLNRHRRAAGDTVRAVPLWDRVLAQAHSDLALSERLARENLAAAERTRSVFWRVSAQASLIEARLAVLVPTKDPTINTARIEALRRVRGQAGELLALARSMAPHFLDEKALEQASDPIACNPRGFESYRYVILALGTADEAKHVFRLGVMRAATGGPFGTDIAGAIWNIQPILAARAIDKNLYQRAMALAGREETKDHCRSGGPPREVCAMATAAAALTELGSPGVAIAVLRDAIEIAESMQLSTSHQAELKLQLARLEWESGNASSAPALLSNLEAMLSNGTIEPKLSIQLLLLKAHISDARLEDSRALDAFNQIVRLSIDWSQRGPRSVQSASERMDKIDPVARAAHATARALVHQHIRRRFCSDCAAPQPYAQAAIDWLQHLFNPSTPPSFIPEPKDFLLTASLPESVWPQAMQRMAEERFRATLHLQDGNDGIGARDEFERLTRYLPRQTTTRTHLRLLALRLGFYDYEATSTESFYKFIQERDLIRKRQLWLSYASPISETQYSQFGADKTQFTDLDDLARNAMATGYMSAARVIFEYLLNQISEGTASGAPKDFAALANNSTLAVGALGRLAAFAIENREWPLAHRLLDLASQLIRDRLTSEWRSGNERAAASMRQLRPAARLIAQLRTRLVTTPESRGARLDGPKVLFSDFQLAMLGDTALSTQIADRRRILADAGLAEAIRRRDEAQLEVQGIQNLQWFYDQNGLIPAAELTRRATQRREEAAAEVNRRIPFPEDLVSPVPLPIADAQRTLAADEALLVLHAGSDGVYGLLVPPTGQPFAWMSRIPIRELETRIETVRRGVDLSGGLLPRFQFEEAAALHDLLLGPARAALAGRQHLLVVSDGPLQSVPLAILPTQSRTEGLAQDEMRAARVPWLIRQHAITILPSVRSVAARQANRLASRAQLAFAGVGDPVLAGAPGSTRAVDFGRAYQRDGVADVDALRRLPALPDTRAEVTRIASALRARPQDILLGQAATEAAVKRHPLGDARILLFATHGLVAGSMQGSNEPGLVLTPPQKGTAGDDGLLTASEISALRLDADLVILSACNTATSDGRARSEGLSGLARAFLSAGARNVVATHWAM